MCADEARPDQQQPPTREPSGRAPDADPRARDPLGRHGAALAAAALAVVLSVFAAALLAAQMPGDYRARALAYLGLVVWVLVGAVVLFVRTAGREQTPFAPRTVALWVVSIWLWPLLGWGRRQR